MAILSVIVIVCSIFWATSAFLSTPRELEPTEGLDSDHTKVLIPEHSTDIEKLKVLDLLSNSNNYSVPTGIVRQIGEDIDVDYIPEDLGIKRVNIGADIDVEDINNKSQAVRVNWGVDVNVDDVPLTSQNTEVVNIGDDISVEEYLSTYRERRNIGDDISVENYLIEQAKSKSNDEG